MKENNEINTTAILMNALSENELEIVFGGMTDKQQEQTIGTNP